MVSRQALLSYLCANPQKVTLENYICLAGIVSKAGWRLVNGQWYKDQTCLPLLDAAKLVMNEDVEAIRADVLRKTVMSSIHAVG
jgi:hypothetical protein